MIPGLLSVDQAIEALNKALAPSHKSRRWMVNFLHRTPTDPHGRPLYRLMGRDKLIYLDRLIEALPTPQVPIVPYASNGNEHEYARLAELTGDKSSMPAPGTYWRRGEVYFIEAGEFIKIGFAIEPENCIREIQVGCPVQAKNLHYERGGRKREKALHKQFAHIRSRGEWFHKTPELLAFIEERKQIRKPT